MVTHELDKPDTLLTSKEPLSSEKIRLRNISLIFITIVGISLEILVGSLLEQPTEYLKLEDIYYIWLEGKKISNGINPYEAILDSDLIRNEKYAAYLPFFYLVSALFHVLGITSFNHFIIFMRALSAIFYILISYKIFLAVYKESFAFAMFLTLYWMFNRWTMIVIYVVHIDFMPLFFLIYSLQNIHKNRTRSLLAYGLSLSMKHMAIFLFPMYLIIIYRDESGKNWKEFTTQVGKILVIPSTLSVPFLIWNPKAFILSMLFSGTRLTDELYDELHDIAEKDQLLAFGIINRIFMLMIMVLVYYLFVKRKIGIFTTSFLIFITFIEFNIALFDQYRVWRVALLPFMLLEIGVFQRKMEVND